jgi:hypothetical protein
MIDESLLMIPEGKATGCLRRKTKFGDCCNPMADEIEVIPREKWGALIGKVSLRPNVRQIIDQGQIGSCATCSTTQGVMIARDVAGLPFVFLNPLSIYHFTSGGRDNGSSIDENLQFARDTGILPESYWPYSRGYRETPPAGWQEVAKQYRIDEFYDIGTVDELGTALLKGFAVVFGWSGHSCILTRLLSETKAEYANSWGSDWSTDGGFGKISLSAINFQYGAFATRTAKSEGGIHIPEPKL